MQTATEEILDIVGLAHDGRGIARLAPENGEEGTSGGRGLTIFVQGALPGQKVRARLEQLKKSWASAVCCEVLSPAPDAVAPHCPHAGHCGGCPLQTMPYARQLAHKEDIVRQALTRIGQLAPDTVDAIFEGITPSPQLTGFRNKLTLAFGDSDADDGPILGLRAEGSHSVVPVPHCGLLPAEGLAIASHIRDLVRDQWAGTGGTFWRFLTLRRGQTADGKDAWWALCLTGPGPKDQRRTVRRVGEDLLTACPQLAGFIHEERRQQDMLAVGERRVCVLGEATLHLPLGGLDFALDAASFFQVNSGTAQELAGHVTDMLAPFAGQGHTLLDCYCGVGAPGLCLAPGFARLLGVEAQKVSITHATQNARNAGLSHCLYEAADSARALSNWVKAYHGDQCVALLDPPRAGLDAKALDALLRLHPLAVLYVSCNPATLARDVAGLVAGGYRPERLQQVDLFPHTAHVESVLLLTRT